MIVTVHLQQRSLPISKISVQEAAVHLCRYLHVTTDEIIFHFVTKEAIAQIHSDFFNDPTPTDCITFPIDQDTPSGHSILGEVFICPEVAIEYASAHQINPYEETTRYLVHGVLHLLGYDDLEESSYAAMHAKENECVKYLAQSARLLSSTKKTSKVDKS